MFITEVESIHILSMAVRHTASALRIANVTWKSGEELLEDIQERDRETYDLLREFLHAYADWFRYHKKTEEMGKHGYLEGEEFDRLTQLAGNRNRTRDDLVFHLAKLP